MLLRPYHRDPDHLNGGAFNRIDHAMYVDLEPRYFRQGLLNGSRLSFLDIWVFNTSLAKPRVSTLPPRLRERQELSKP
jgi:hypothetical protein